jgi:hypothetical protein
LKFKFGFKSIDKILSYLFVCLPFFHFAECLKIPDR